MEGIYKSSHFIPIYIIMILKYENSLIYINLFKNNSFCFCKAHPYYIYCHNEHFFIYNSNTVYTYYMWVPIPNQKYVQCEFFVVFSFQNVEYVRTFSLYFPILSACVYEYSWFSGALNSQPW